MSEAFVRRTLASAHSVSGIGIHTGIPAKLTLSPAPFGTGLHFVQQGAYLPVTIHSARAEPGCTVLVSGEATVYTPEHLLAALCALGVTDAVLDLDGPEVPALDGSSRGWVEAIDAAGRVLGPLLAPFRTSRRVEIAQAGGRATVEPGASVSVQIDFPGGPSGALSIPLTEAAFRREVMWARTFVREDDVERLRASGRGRGATPENTILWPSAPMRSADEPIRHKLLDAWGDLALLGPCELALSVVRGSHTLHHALLREVAAERDAA